jgi:hypothetical protein
VAKASADATGNSSHAKVLSSTQNNIQISHPKLLRHIDDSPTLLVPFKSRANVTFDSMSAVWQDEQNKKRQTREDGLDVYEPR